jgi:CRISPR/Cas system CSM-associated protein Csm3 (group 7 of RAMP superfamily)
MSRPVSTRFRIAGTVVTETPIHVGGVDGNPATDLPLSVNGQGRRYVPGTSLAGPLRHWLVERFVRAAVEEFWGRIPEKGKANDMGRASHVLVEDAEVPPTSQVEIRDSVGIDREYGTAADGIKFDREVLPRGTRIGLCMTVDSPDGRSGQGEVRALLEAMMRGEVRLGAAKTRGLGRVRLEDDVRVQRFDIATRDGILALLRSRGAPSIGNAGLEALGDRAQARQQPRIEIQIGWVPTGPVMVKASADGTAIDMMPLVTANGAGQEAPVIPGASAKGALRQHSERILATALGLPVAADAPGQQRFIGQLGRMALIETLYGAVKKREKDKHNARRGGGATKGPGRGALSVDDCLAQCSLPRAAWVDIADAALTKDQASAEEKVRAADLRAHAARNSIDIATHVAIDRWTGGAADGALFTAAEPRLAWEPLRIEIDPTRLVPSDEKTVSDPGIVAQAAIALLLLTLRDMAAGLVPLGFGVNRGYGDVEVKSVALTVEHAPEGSWLAALDGLRLTPHNGRVDLPKDRLAGLAGAWKRYLEAQLSPVTDRSEEAHP